jgi:ABC-2 type transport system ATP-binding protein
MEVTMRRDNTQYAIETVELSKRFGKQSAVNELTMRVPAGSVFAFLGTNGAGKTTTIRMLLDLLNKTSGESRVLGLDSVKDSMEARKRTGYVAESQKMYDWMKVDEIIWFCKQFHKSWDDDYAAQLKARLELLGGKKVRELSRGTQAKLGLLLALAYRPELLILDEPTAGLDVLVRRNFIEEVIEITQDEGRTVFFSSHQVNEVERVADWVGIIDQGRMMWCSSLDDLKASVKRMVLTFDVAPRSFQSIPGLLSVDGGGRQIAVAVRDFSEACTEAAKQLGAASITVQDLDLENIFVEMVGRAEVA